MHATKGSVLKSAANKSSWLCSVFTPWRSWPSLSQALCCTWWLVLGNPERQIWRWYLFRNLLNTSKDLASISWWNGQPVRQKWAKASHPSYLTPQGFLCGKKTKSPNFPGKSHIANNQASSCNHIVVCIPKYYKIPLKRVALLDPRQKPFQTKDPQSWQFKSACLGLHGRRPPLHGKDPGWWSYYS